MMMDSTHKPRTIAVHGIVGVGKSTYLEKFCAEHPEYIPVPEDLGEYAPFFAKANESRKLEPGTLNLD